jgi:hypothetical protein
MALLVCCPGPVSAGQPGKGGNAVLMEAWKARQQELSQKIAQRLFEEGRIPRDGTVRYTARVKPDATAAGGLELRVDSLSVAPAGPGNGVRVEGQAAKQAMDAALAPRDPDIAVRLQNLDVPVGTEVSGTLVIKDGKPIAEPPVEPAPETPAPKEPSLWQQLLNVLGF